MNLTEIFKNRSLIWEGLKNKVFKNEHVEAVYEDRIAICKVCESYDITGTGCAIPGTGPCCNKDNGGCGCSLSLKLRSLSSDCPKNKWKAVVNKQEEDMIRSQILNEQMNGTND